METNALHIALAKSPYRDLIRTISGPPGALRFFRGCSPTISDLDAGWGILRSVVVGSRTVSFDDFADTLSELAPGSIFVLRANTGEGKSTFLSQLAWRLRGTRTVLFWHDLGRHNAELLRDIQSSGVPILIVTEITPAVSSETLFRVGTVLSANPLPCPLLICGATNDLMRAELRGVTHISFERLTIANISTLVGQLRKAFREADAATSLEDTPNLPLFVNDPDPSVFSENSLFVGLLKATYGTEFRLRLADEYRRLEHVSPLAQLIYRHVCYCHSVGFDAPVSLLRRLGNPGDISRLIDRCGNGSPWEIVDGGVRSRHRLIAQTVLVELKCLAGLPFDEFLEQVFRSGTGDSDYVRFVGELLGEYGRWRRLDGPQLRHECGQIRKAIRNRLQRSRDWTAKAQKMTASRGEYFTAASWSSVAYELLPDDIRNPNARTIVAAVLDIHRSWLGIAESMAPPVARHRIAYWKSKAEVIEAESGRGDLDAVTEKVLDTWKGLFWQGNLGIAFYIDLMNLAGQRASSGTDRDEIRNWFRIAAMAAEHATALTHRSQVGVEVMHASVLQRACGRLTPDEFLSVLREAWRTSVALDCPNAKTGCWLAERLVAAGDDDAAQQVLKKVLATTVWGDALLLLAQISSGDQSAHSFICEYVDCRREGFSTIAPLNVALMLQAFALVSRFRSDTETEVQALDSACAYYELAAGAALEKMWELHGSVQWKAVVSRLRELSAPTAPKCAAAWEAAAARSALTVSVWR